jgi:hypothetical protein
VFLQYVREQTRNNASTPCGDVKMERDEYAEKMEKVCEELNKEFAVFLATANTDALRREWAERLGLTEEDLAEIDAVQP